MAASDCSDDELMEYLQEIDVVIRSIASVLEEFDQ
jgi:hypothetical protein